METSKESIQAVFDSFDKDHSGFIDFTEIIKVAQELGQQITQAEVTKVNNSLNLNSADNYFFTFRFSVILIRTRTAKLVLKSFTPGGNMAEIISLRHWLYFSSKP